MLTKKIKTNFSDYFIGILIIFTFTWNPNFAHGYIVGPDEGQHLAWINEILHGKILYKDIYMFYGPLLEFMPAVFMKITGISLANLRLFYLFSKVFTLITAFLILKLVLKKRVFVYLSLLVLITTQISDFWTTRWGGPRLIFGLLAVYFFIIYLQKQNSRTLVMAGFSSGLSFFSSQEVGIVIIFASIATLLCLTIQGNKKIDIQKFQPLFSRYLSGFLIIAVPLIVYLIVNGAFLDYIKINFWDLPFKYSKVFGQAGFNLILFKNLGFFLKNPLHFVSYYSMKFLLILSIYITAIIFLLIFNPFKTNHKKGIILLFVIFFGLPLLATNLRQVVGEQSAFYSPIAIIISFILLDQIVNLSKTNNIKKVIAFSMGMILIFDLTFYLFLESSTQRRIVNTIESYLALKKPAKDRFGNFIGSYHADGHERQARSHGKWERLNINRAKGIYLPEGQGKVVSGVVSFIQRNTALKESIFVFPHEGQYYFLTNRPSPTRFTPTIYGAIDADYQREVVSDLERAKVRYIIYVKDAFVFTDYNKIPNEERLNLIYKYMVENYQIIKQYGKTFILVKKEGNDA